MRKLPPSGPRPCTSGIDAAGLRAGSVLPRALLLLSALLAAGCEGELGNGTPTPPPPPDPHDQSDDETVYWDPLNTDSSALALYGVTGFDADELYLAGEAGTVWQWDGSSLEPAAEALLTSEGEAPSLYGVWSVADGLGRQVIVVGQYGSIFRNQFDGQGFVRMETGTRAAFRAVYGFGRADVWAVGDGGAYHYDGHSWTRDTTLPGSASLEAVWGLSSEDLYVVGDDGTLVHRSGATWTPVSLGRGEDLHAVWGLDGSSIYVVGQQGLLLHFDGSSWKQEETGVFDHLWAVWGLAGDQVFAAGTNGTVLFYNGEGWQRLPTGSARNLYGFWGLDMTQVYAAGAWSTLLRFDNDPAPPPLPEEE